MSKISLMAKLVAHPGKGDELASVLEEMFTHVEHEPGTEVYVLNRSNEDPDTFFFFFDLYSNAEAFAAHRRSDVMKEIGASFAPLIKDRELLVRSPLKAIGLSL